MLLLLACAQPDDSADTADKAAPLTWTDPDGQSLTLGADGAFTLTDATGATRALDLALGDVPGAEDTENFDPWNLYTDAWDAAPSDLAWARPVAAERDGDTVLLTLDDDRGAQLTVDDTGPGLRLQVQAPDHWYPYARLAVPVAEDEEFYGLGEQFESVRQRGHVRAMQFEADFDRESGYNEVHVPVPLLVSSAGWGMLADSFMPGAVDVAAVETDRVTMTFNQTDGISFDLYAPGRPRDVVARYHARTGPAEVPPTWAFAPLQWRNEVSGSTDVRADAEAIRTLGVPTGVIWVDNPWQTFYNSMVPDPTMFPDWDTLIDELHADGFRMLAWTTPYLDEDDPEHDTYEANGWLVTGQLLFSDFGDFVDLTNPDAAAAWAGRAQAARDNGIEGWKLDYGEDIQVGIAAAAVQWTLDNGQDERTMHHQFAQDYHRAYALDGDGVLIGRGGCLRGHTITDVIWPGDLDSDFERWDDECYGDGLCVGGLPSAIRAGTSLAASGYPYFASDTGGFRHDRPTKEALLRWAEYSAMLPIMQYGGGGDDHNPWNFTDYGASHYDEETLDLFTQYASLHIRLFPYFWLLSEQMSATGLPIVMAQGLAFPEAGVHTDDSFLVGDDLFVAPVETEGATSRTTTLPPGAWVHWWSGERYDGETTVTVDAPLGESPLFVREGAAVPMLRRSVMTLSPAVGVDSWDSDPGVLNARVVPGEGGFTLSSGEAIVVDGATVTLTDGGLYSGWDLEIWAPDATTVTADGLEVEAGEEGCTSCWFRDGAWMRVALDSAATVTVE